MKTKPTQVILFMCALMFGGINTINAQSQTDKPNRFTETNKAIGKAFFEMYDNAIIAKPSKLKTCTAESLIDIVDKNDLDVTHRLTTTHLTILNTLFPPNQYRLAGFYDKGEFLTLQDRIMNAASISSNFAEFINNATGLDVGDITATRKPKTYTIAEGIEVKDIDLFRSYYNSVNSFVGVWNEIDSENRAEYGEQSGFNVDLSPTKYVGNKDGCSFYSKSKIRLKKLEYPKALWELSTEVYVDCECNENDTENKVKNGSYEYSSFVEGLFTYSKTTFGSPKSPIITIKSLECCPPKEDKEEPTETALNDDEGIKDLMPDQTMGFGAGVGFGQDFEETTWCVTAEYLYQINTDEYKGWYVGGEVTHSNTSFGDFSSNRTLAGAKIQYNISAVPSGETQFVAGLMANYGFGNTDNNGFKDDFTGTIFCAYGGANIRVCENWSIGLQFPILIFENFTFKPESGGEFKTDATSLFINKDNPLKIIIRRRL
nr:hypothetical protein [uncultured Psychroserpens sp.]